MIHEGHEAGVVHIACMSREDKVMVTCDRHSRHDELGRDGEGLCACGGCSGGSEVGRVLVVEVL